MSQEENLYSGPNGFYNISGPIESLNLSQQSQDHSISSISRDEPTAGTQNELRMGSGRNYLSQQSQTVPPAEKGGVGGFYQHPVANPHSQYIESGAGSTYGGGDTTFGYPLTLTPSNPYASGYASPQDILGSPRTYARLAESQSLNGYFPLVPATHPALQAADQFAAENRLSPSGSGGTVRGPQVLTTSWRENLVRLRRFETLEEYRAYMQQFTGSAPSVEPNESGTNADYNEVYDPEFFLGFKSAYATNKLSDLEGAVVGVDATSYLQHMTGAGKVQGPAHEPLLSALGGEPIGWKYHIENELDNWKNNGIKPLFVFDGQSIVGKDETDLRNARAALKKTEAAWKLYSEASTEAVRTFGTAGAVRVQELYRALQEVLSERDMDFQIAPFSAGAQLVYLLNTPDSTGNYYIDAVMGSRELLLYDRSPDATVINPPTVEDWEKKEFSGTYRSEVMERINVTSDMLDDALLMVGTSFLPPFPPLLPTESIITQQPFSLVDAVNLLRTSEKSVTSMCVQFQDILEKRDPKWLDKYRKAKMGVRHAIIVKLDGTVISRDYENLTSDNNEYLGLQLPAELYHYLRKALIGPRIMNHFISLESVVFPTLDGVVSDEYKKLVTKTLLPLKETTAALIASRIHRMFQNKNVTMKFWYDDSQSQTLSHKTILSQPNSKADTWKVLDSELKSMEKEIGVPAGSLPFALRSLLKDGFSAKSISDPKEATPKVYLESRSEILSNTLWRVLHIRGYINDQHQLTGWGKALAATLESIAPIIKKHKDVHQVEEACFLAYELMRFENLNSRNLHPELIGTPLRGTDEDKENCILIARTASLLKLRHENIGYTGPLSKNLLAYNSIVKAVRETDRDLTEAVVTSMFLDDQATRKKEHDFGELGRSLPFSKAVNTIFGIAVLTYLDDFLQLEWTPAQRREKTPAWVKEYVRYSINFTEDLEVAFDFFEALYAGVKTLDSEMTPADKKAWNSAKVYLEKRR